jgi:hypothetical protein
MRRVNLLGACFFGFSGGALPPKHSFKKGKRSFKEPATAVSELFLLADPTSSEIQRKHNAVPSRPYHHGNQSSLLDCSFAAAKGDKVIIPNLNPPKLIEKHQEACRWRKQASLNDGFQFKSDMCGAHSTGNMLAQIYLVRLILNVSLRCDSPNTVQQYATHTAKFNGWNACTCKSMFPHTCKSGLELAVPLIRDDMRELARQWRCANPKENIDDAIIHMRCGDILKPPPSRPCTEYGFSYYKTYIDCIPANVRSIGIISAPFDGECRPGDCRFRTPCRILLEDLQNFLHYAFPEATIVLRSNESVVTSYARIGLAKVAICNPSTFCLYPTIASMGRGFLISSEKLYPWIDRISSAHANVTILHKPFYSAARIAGTSNLKPILAALKKIPGSQVTSLTICNTVGH